VHQAAPTQSTSTRPLVRRAGQVARVSALLLALALPASADAGTPSPDPAPTHAATKAPGNPTPDPAPPAAGSSTGVSTTRASQLQGGGTRSQSGLKGTPSETGISTPLATDRRSTATGNPQTTAGRGARHHTHSRPTANTLGQASRNHGLGNVRVRAHNALGTGASATGPTLGRGGLWLLVGSGLLLVLAAAAAALLWFLRRLAGDWAEGPA
jgi:hypothetical protein